MRKYFVTIILFFCIYSIGCTKLPEKIQSPGIKIDVIIEGNIEKYSLRFSAGIRNDNQDMAFINYKGNIDFINPGNGKSVVMSIPFTLPLVLPLNSGIIDTKIVKDEKQIMGLLDLLEIDKEKLINEKSAEKFNIDARFVKMTGLTYEKKQIQKILREKIDEKN